MSGASTDPRRDAVALMGIVNLTPDSFFDGGRFDASGSAVRHAERLVTEGARVIDLGAESTRPGSRAVPADEQIARLGSTVRDVARFARVSIDTTDARVAAWALDEGASMLNSVSLDVAGAFGELARARGAELVLMHSRGAMASMPGFSTYAPNRYGDVVEDVAREWSAAAARALASGLSPSALWFDPGIGFHKNADHSLELLARLHEFPARLAGTSADLRMLVGTSRKSFIAARSPAAPDARLGGSIATCLSAAMRGARLLRVHDVEPVRQALDLFFAVERSIEPRTAAPLEAPPP
ncbi:MAG: dihydropteroate synthase [Polyangiaceae bacterium]